MSLRCTVCESRSDLTKHHVVPRKAGGRNDPSNLVVLCALCHALVERFYWRVMAQTNPRVARYLKTLMEACRDNRIRPDAKSTARARMRDAWDALLAPAFDWASVYEAAVAWIKTIEVIRPVAIGKHNPVLQDPWWKTR